MPRYGLPLVLLALFAPYGARAQPYFVEADATHLPAGPRPEAGMDVEAADLDGDGDLDLLFANEFQPNGVLINDGHGRFTDESARRFPALPTPLPGPPQVATGRDSEDIAVGDFDGDGDLDVVFVSEDDVRVGRTGVHEYYLNDGRGHFTVAPYRLPDSEANAVAVADVNGDGHLDLALGNAGQDGLLFGVGDGTFRDVTATHLPAEDRLCQDLEFADVDGDGDLDLVAGNEDGNRLYLNDGTGRFTDATAERLGALPDMETRKVTVADVDRDGDLDLVFSNVAFRPGKDPRSRLYLNDGTGRFADATATHLPDDIGMAIDAKAVDADGDGDLDLLFGRFPQTETVRTLANDGRGRFTDAALIPTVTGDALAIEVADLNGDRQTDLLFVFRSPALRDRLLLGIGRGATRGTGGH